jgi:hypothetical protein
MMSSGALFAAEEVIAAQLSGVAIFLLPVLTFLLSEGSNLFLRSESMGDSVMTVL